MLDEVTGEEGAPRLTRAQDQALQKLLSNYKLTPMTLALRLNQNLIPARWMMYVSTIIATTIAKGNGRLIISVPPRHGKSELVTKNVPIWAMENFGKKNVILCSYGGDLSSDFGRQVRDLIKDNESLLNVRIRPDAERVNNWLNQYGGAMFSVGLGGPITGRGADVLIIDDYIKEIKESLSELHRNYIWDWFVTTAFTRLEPGATVIIVATRWHHDDLIGRILKHKPGRHPWTNICIPAIAEEGDPLGRPVGTPLFEERYPLEELEDRKLTLGSFFFNALFQQRPENDAGQLTDKRWVKFFSAIPTLEGFKVGRVWDLACKEEGGDYIVGSLLAYNRERDMTILIERERAQTNPLGVEKMVAETAKRDGVSIPIYIEQEPGSSGKLLVENYSRTILKGYNVIGVPATPKHNKVTRAQPFLAAVEAGRFYMVQGDWNKAWLDEYDSFPAGDHDDQVDTCAIGYTMLSGKQALRASWGRAPSAAPQSDLLQTMAKLNGDPTSNLIVLPNGKTYDMQGNFVANDNGVIVPRRMGVTWGRSRISAR